MDNLVLREDRNGAAILTLNRPQKLNALNKDMFEALEVHADALAREARTIGLVIIRGAGHNFSSGYDMEEVQELVEARAKPHFHSEIIEKIANLPQPVISAIEGHCSTGALELALAADLIVSTRTAQFSDVYARWGLTPIWGLSLRLPHRIGTAQAAEMMFSCRTYNGVEAHQMHLVNFCFDDARFESDLDVLAKDILANSWLIATAGLTMREAHALDLFKNEGLAPDAEDRVARFLDKKPR
jgi:enoyl-CoA hydratase/carnithine racemase